MANKSKEHDNYVGQAVEDAKGTARYFLSDIMYSINEQIEERDGDDPPDTFDASYEFTLSDDLHNDYANGDEYHHESHVDQEYDLLEAATILDQLDQFEETDNGLWQGLSPREAISAQAAYTYGNAVLYYFQRLIAHLVNELNNDPILTDMMGLDDRASIGQIEGRIKELIDQFRD